MIKTIQEQTPVLAPTVRMADSAVAVGAVTVADQASLWYGAVLRGDDGPIYVGERSNIQDNAVLHCDVALPLQVGRGVTVGHGAILHSCTIGDNCVIGMGAILLNNCVIGDNCLVAAGALVTQGKSFPPGSMIMGSPAKAVRPLREEEIAGLRASAETYLHGAAVQLPAVGEGAQP